MVLTEETVNQIVDGLGARLNAGFLAFFASPASVLQPLVLIPLGSPAFHAAQAGIAEAQDLPSTVIERTGEARLAQLLTATQTAIATLTVKGQDDPDRNQADVILDRTDFHQGGMVTISRCLLRMPRTP